MNDISSIIPTDSLPGKVRAAWIGGASMPASFKPLNEFFQASKDFRAPPSLNQTFQLVVYGGQDLGSVKAWKLIVDEALRLLVPGGVLVLEYKESPLLSGFELKSFLLAWAGQRICLEAETKEPDGTFRSVFRLTHVEKRDTSTSGWTFGILTNGTRPENLIRFIESVRAISGLRDFEILVCGPKADLGQLSDRVTFIEPPAKFEKEGWITKKKNLIASRAAFSNVLVAHDRYFLQPDFLQRMEEFGGDFDVLTVRQETASGERFPDWVSAGAAWQVTPVGMLEYDDYSPYNYVNGGLILAKTRVLQRVPWNELLFWAQTEDVELSRRLEAAGFVHRLHRRLVVKTTDRPEYVLTFPKLPVLQDHFVIPFRADTLPFVFYDGVSLNYGGVGRHGYVARVVNSIVRKTGLREAVRSRILASKPRLIQLRVNLYRRYPRLAKRLDRIAQALYFEVR